MIAEMTFGILRKAGSELAVLQALRSDDFLSH